MPYYNPDTKRFAPADLRELFVPGVGIVKGPEESDFLAAGFLPVRFEELTSLKKYAEGSVVGGEWVIPVIDMTLSEGQAAKHKEIKSAYAATCQGTKTINNVDWPIKYEFTRILRDKRDFAREEGLGNAVVITDAGGAIHVLDDTEASNLLITLGQETRALADNRDNLLQQIAQANSIPDLRNINW